MKQVDTARELFRKVDATAIDDNPEQILEQSVDRTVSSIDEIDSDKYDSLYVGNEYTFVANSELMGYEVEMKSGIGYAVMLPDMLVAILH